MIARKWLVSAATLSLLLCALVSASTAATLARQQLHWKKCAAATVGACVDSLRFTENAANERDTSAWVAPNLAAPRTGTVADSSLYLRITIWPALGSLYSTQPTLSADSLYAYIQAGFGATLQTKAAPAELDQGGGGGGMGAAKSTGEPNGGSAWTWSISWGRILAAAGGADFRNPQAIRVIIRGDASAANTGEFEGQVEWLQSEGVPQ